MNLNALAGGVVAAVNPPVAGFISRSIGAATLPSGKRAPAYAYPEACQLQVQPLSSQDLRQLDNLNIQGVERAVYVNTGVNGADRLSETGGDVLIFDGRVWLATAILEPWTGAGWTKVGVTGQLDAV